LSSLAAALGYWPFAYTYTCWRTKETLFGRPYANTVWREFFFLSSHNIIRLPVNIGRALYRYLRRRTFHMYECIILLLLYTLLLCTLFCSLCRLPCGARFRRRYTYTRRRVPRLNPFLVTSRNSLKSTISGWL